jgi:hypothetical protein
MGFSPSVKQSQPDPSAQIQGRARSAETHPPQAARHTPDWMRQVQDSADCASLCHKTRCASSSFVSISTAQSGSSWTRHRL